MLLQPPEKQWENGGSLSRPALLMPSGQGHRLYKNGVSVVSQVPCRSLEIAENKQPGHSLPPQSFTETKEKGSFGPGSQEGAPPGWGVNQ